jgi:hypothetical protein
MTQPVYYFAYGANMSNEILQRRRGLRPLSFEPARLDGWKMVFEQPGLRYIEPVFSTLIEAPENCVQGVLYRLSNADIERLNRTEGAGYVLINLVVTGNTSHCVEAFTYISSENCTDQKPSRTYLRKLIRGAMEHSLPEPYIEQLRAVETVHIPLLSYLMDKIGWLAIRYTASGRTLNNKLLKFGASTRHDH